MRKLNELPRTVHIVNKKWHDLKIKNHHVNGGGSLTYWMIGTMRHGLWDNAVTQMIQQVFKFDSFVEECITNMQDFLTFGFTLYNLGLEKDITERMEFSKSKSGRKIRAEYVKKLKACKNWNQLYSAMHPDSDFQKKMKRKIMEEFEKCKK